MPLEHGQAAAPASDILERLPFQQLKNALLAYLKGLKIVMFTQRVKLEPLSLANNYILV